MFNGNLTIDNIPKPLFDEYINDKQYTFFDYKNIGHEIYEYKSENDNILFKFLITFERKDNKDININDLNYLEKKIEIKSYINNTLSDLQLTKEYTNSGFLYNFTGYSNNKYLLDFFIKEYNSPIKIKGILLQDIHLNMTERERKVYEYNIIDLLNMSFFSSIYDPNEDIRKEIIRLLKIIEKNTKNTKLSKYSKEICKVPYVLLQNKKYTDSIKNLINKSNKDLIEKQVSEDYEEVSKEIKEFKDNKEKENRDNIKKISNEIKNLSFKQLSFDESIKKINEDIGEDKDKLEDAQASTTEVKLKIVEFLAEGYDSNIIKNLALTIFSPVILAMSLAAFGLAIPFAILSSPIIEMVYDYNNPPDFLSKNSYLTWGHLGSEMKIGKFIENTQNKYDKNLKSLLKKHNIIPTEIIYENEKKLYEFIKYNEKLKITDQMEVINSIYKLRKIEAKCFTIGVIGLMNSGKTTFIKSLGFNDAKPSSKDHTNKVTPYKPSNNKFQILDFPGNDDIRDRIKKAFMCNYNIADLYIIICDVQKVDSESLNSILFPLFKTNNTNCILILNKIDTVIRDYENIDEFENEIKHKTLHISQHAKSNKKDIKIYPVCLEDEEEIIPRTFKKLKDFNIIIKSEIKEKILYPNLEKIKEKYNKF